MKKLMLFLMAALMCTFAFAGCAEKDDYEYIKKRGKLIIGITYFEPMNYKDDQEKLIGFDTEFAEAVCEALGVQAEFQVIDWSKKEFELNSKAIDCIWNGFTVTEERRQNVDFTVSYLKNKQCIVIRKSDAETYTSLQALAAAKFGAENESAGESAIKGNDTLKNVNFTGVESQKKVLLELKSLTIDAGVIDYTMAKASIREDSDYSGLMILDLELSEEEEYAIGFRKGSNLDEKVNEIIEQLVANGTIAQIAEKYNLTDLLTDALK
ncbi:MAG: transporter substrate-binding domain-containing protein [Clostridiales bacterium]|nr:transporter substrate-binding domain-containing protein [Clostridiales bacterium]